MLMPVVWYEVEDRANPTGAGPLLLTWALLYSGVNSFMLNFSDPTWGAPDPFVTAILRAAAEKKSAAQAATHYSRELSAYSDSAFSGKPPSWAGWIMFGDPR
jgi:hypothetical protein